MKNQILSIGTALSKTELKAINGGRSGCSVYVRYDDGYGYWSDGLSLSQAQGLYGETFENLGGFGDATVTGWCCASCDH